jgi:hypothetical protein
MDDQHGATVFKHACKLGLEGIATKRVIDRIAQGGRRTGFKIKHPAAPAAGRLIEE